MNSLDAQAELRWLFRDAEGDMGLRSNFAGMVAALEGGGFHPRPSYSMDERQVRAAESAREMRKALAAAPVWAQVVIGVALKDPYAEERHALIAATLAAVEEWRRSRSKRPLHEWLEKQRTSKEQVKRRKFLQLREGARATLDEALTAYARCRRAKEPDLVAR
jgi:hypothetical protein